ncbi:MAG: hypothetical protein QE271_03470 [Bacteriovoracaceae bacterium]|nr:hypothetical protein [Bacteriovoracaceae bacterium]
MVNVLKENQNERDVQLLLIQNYFSQVGENVDLDKSFCQMLATKKKGYLTMHESRFLPVNTYDYFSIHILLCDRQSKEIILTAKIVTYFDCEFYHLKFPLLDMEGVFNPLEMQEVKKIISTRVNLGQNISYSGGWTINPKFKGLGMSSLLRDIYTGIHYQVHQYFNIHTMMGFGAPKVGSLEFFKKWGVRPLVVEGNEMSPIAMPFCNFTELVMAWGDISDLSDYKKEMGQKYNSIWQNRKEYLLRNNIKVAS